MSEIQLFPLSYAKSREGFLAEADAAGATVTVHVERTNRARRLYERLGFAVAAEDPVYVTLERAPALNPMRRAADS